MSGQRSAGSFASARDTATSSHGGSPGAHAARQRGGTVQMRGHDRHRIAAFERQPAGRKLEDHHPHRIHVRPGIDRSAGQLLGRRVGHGADELLRPGQPKLVCLLPDGRHAEIHYLVDASIAEVVRDDVRRLQVAMDDVPGMGEVRARSKPAG